MDAAQKLLEEETGLKLTLNTGNIPKSGCLFPAVMQVFYELAIRQALDVKDETNLEERLVAMRYFISVAPITAPG